MSIDPSAQTRHQPRNGAAVRKESRLRVWLRCARSNTETEQALLRILVELILTVYLGVSLLADGIVQASDLRVLLTAGGFLVVAIFLYKETRRERFTVRRQRVLFASANDALGISLTLVLGGTSGLPAFGVYLWVIFGYGFRYGTRELYVSQALSVVGFIGAVLATPALHQNIPLASAFLIMLAALPVYVAYLIRRLHEEKALAQSASKAKSAFLANMSHEIRTPLNGILGAKQLLEDTSLNGSQRELVQTLSTSSEALLSVINDILDFSKVEAGKIIPRPEAFQLRELLAKCISIFAPLARNKGLELRTEIDGAVPDYLMGDADFIRQICANLLANAIKFTDAGSVALRVREIASGEYRFEVNDTGIGIAQEAQPHIFDSFYQGDNTSTRKYGGTGLGTAISRGLVEAMGGTIGLSSEVGKGTCFWFVLPLRLAQPPTPRAIDDLIVLLVSDDSALRNAIKHHLDGWGTKVEVLGSTEIRLSRPGRLEAHIALIDDRVRLEPEAWRAVAVNLRNPAFVSIVGLSRIDQVVPVDLPAAPLPSLTNPVQKRQLFSLLHQCLAAPVEPASQWIVEPPVSATPIRTGRILLAEDNAINRKIVGAMLERMGHAIQIVTDGESALDEIADADWDLVIVDLMMPGKGGLDVIKGLRFLEVTSKRRTPVIVLTADATSDAADRCLAAGANAFITKPVDARTLEALISQLLNGGADPGYVSAKLSSPNQAASQVNASPDIDVDAFTSSCLVSTRDDFATQLVRGFGDDTKPLLSAMRTALQNEQFEDFRDHAHAIKGAAGSLGAMRMFELCRRIERSSNPELRSVGSRLLAQLASEREAALTELHRLLPLIKVGNNRAET